MGLPSFPDMSRAGRGEPRPPHDLIGAWSDTADPNNRILSRPVSVPSARSRRARKERSETCKTNRHPAPAGRSSAGSTPTPTRTGCASWTGGAARSCPASSPPTRRATRRSPGRSRRPGSRPASRWRGRRPTGRASPGTSRRLGCPCARRSPRRGCRGGARGRGSATSRTRRGRPARRCPAQSSGPPRARTGGSTGCAACSRRAPGR